MKRAEITTAQLVEMTGVPKWTIRRLASILGGIPIGGTIGFKFPASAPERLVAELRKRHSQARRGRKPRHIAHLLKKEAH